MTKKEFLDQHPSGAKGIAVLHDNKHFCRACCELLEVKEDDISSIEEGKSFFCKPCQFSVH